MVSVFFVFSTFFGWMSSLTYAFTLFLILFLIFTLVIATVTLIERKILALTQRRVGPNYIGYKGRLQFMADALKLILKHITVLPKTNRLFFLFLPVSICFISYTFWVNLIWGPNLQFVEVEYNLLVVGLLSSFYSLLLIIVGFITKNKYASLASTRVVITTLLLELLFISFMIILAYLCECLNFALLKTYQTHFRINFWIFAPLMPIMFATFFLETGRLPYDFQEAESELISGYSTEFGGFYFALFYLGEYFHLYSFSVVYASCLFGG